MKIQVTISDEVVDKIDFYAKQMGTSRSSLCANFIGQGIMGYDQTYKLLAEKINEGIENDNKGK